MNHRNSRFANVMRSLAIVYPDANISAELIEEYAKVLEGIPIEVIEYMAEQHKRTSKWFPRPCELAPQRTPAAEYVSRWRSQAKRQAAISQQDRLLLAESQRHARQSPSLLESFKSVGDVIAAKATNG